MLSDYVTISKASKLTEGMYTEGALRMMIYRKRKHGLGKCVLKIDGKLLIDIKEFEKWIVGHRIDENT